MNAIRVVRSDYPHAIILAKDGGNDQHDMMGLSCNDFGTSIYKHDVDIVKHLFLHSNIGCLLLLADIPFQEKIDIAQTVRSHPKLHDLPIIALYSEEDPVGINRMLLAGINQVVSKSRKLEIVRSHVSIVIEEYVRLNQLRKELSIKADAIGQIVSGVFKLSTREEAQNLASLLSTTAPEPISIAVGLSELLINAVEHGCLDIRFERKGELIKQGRLVEEINERSLNNSREITLEYNRHDDQIIYVITDEGSGFDHKLFMSKEADHLRQHGRGILMARACFSSLEYNECGNQVKAICNL